MIVRTEWLAGHACGTGSASNLGAWAHRASWLTTKESAPKGSPTELLHPFPHPGKPRELEWPTTELTIRRVTAKRRFTLPVSSVAALAGTWREAASRNSRPLALTIKARPDAGFQR